MKELFVVVVCCVCKVLHKVALDREGRQLLQAHNGQFRLLALALTLRMKLKEDLRGVTTIVIRLPQP
jgi:hypothetical protein